MVLQQQAVDVSFPKMMVFVSEDDLLGTQIDDKNTKGVNIDMLQRQNKEADLLKSFPRIDSILYVGEQVNFCIINNHIKWRYCLELGEQVNILHHQHSYQMEMQHIIWRISPCLHHQLY